MAAREIKTGKPPGRPRNFVPRYHATVRLTPKLYADIKGAAEASRRSINEEIESRLERLALLESKRLPAAADIKRVLREIEALRQRVEEALMPPAKPKGRVA
jgi:hypothetical protein